MTKARLMPQAGSAKGTRERLHALVCARRWLEDGRAFPRKPVERITTMDVETLAKSRYLSVTTFRRDGTPVVTPVWLARQGDELVTSSGSLSGKAKRLRNSSRVLLAPCDMRGRVTGDTVEGTARFQDQAETAVTISLIRQRYGLQARLAFWWYSRHVEARPSGGRVGIAFRLDGPAEA